MIAKQKELVQKTSAKVLTSAEANRAMLAPAANKNAAISMHAIPPVVGPPALVGILRKGHGLTVRERSSYLGA